MNTDTPIKPPPSATYQPFNLLGLLVSLSVLLIINITGSGLTQLQAGLLCLAAYAVPIALCEAFYLKTFQRNSAGLQFRIQPKQTFCLSRCLIKLCGFYATLLVIAFVYWLFPEYHGDFYKHYYTLLRNCLPAVCILAIPYIFLIDRHMLEPRDGYWQMGQIVLGRWKNRDRPALLQFWLGWIVKAFFLPLMFIYFDNNLNTLRNTDTSSLLSSFQAFFDFAFILIFYVDLLVVVTGYMLTLRILDSHIRSTEPTLLGWLVAISCYQPFWSSFSSHYFSYADNSPWGVWLSGEPFFYILWGSAILILLCIYSWASLTFGLRFSNLTHRGILTNGPYRYCKHPAYVSKNLSWWMISMPFLSKAGVDEALRHSLMLLLLNFIYYLRAITEERHLSRDPVYTAYQEYIATAGLYARIISWARRLFSTGSNNR